MLSPYYEDGKSGITIYCADCRDVLSQLVRGDLVLTDPPYGHGDKWAGGTWATNPIYKAAFQWDAQTADTDTMNLVLRAAPNVIIWGGNYYALPPSRCWLAWEKTNGMATMADFELAWTNFDRPAKLFRAASNPDGVREHPTQKPLSLMRWCLSFVPNAHVVIDPFCGSGTTLRAAKDAGMKAIGIEIDERYAEIAARRLEQEVIPFHDYGCRYGDQDQQQRQAGLFDAD